MGNNGENLVSTLVPSFLIGSSSYLQVTRTSIISQTSSNIRQIRPRTAELAAEERLKKFPWTYNGENLVSTLSHSFLIGSSSSLQVTRTTVKAWMSSNFGRILAGMEDNHNISGHFEIRQDSTTDCGVSCP